MQVPLVALGHSLGTTQLIAAALTHPRLFTSIVAIEVGIDPGDAEHSVMTAIGLQMKLNARRRDTWSSRDEARQRLLASPVYASWDPRAFAGEVEYGLREVSEKPNSVHRGVDRQTKRKVTLTTPKVMQITTDLRPDPPLSGYPLAPDFASRHKNASIVPGFYRTEPKWIYSNMTTLFPSILYVWGEASAIIAQPYREAVVKASGTDHGGSAGRVSQSLVPGGHFAPLEHPDATAIAILEWLQPDMARWVREYKERRDSEPPHSAEINPELLARISKL